MTTIQTRLRFVSNIAATPTTTLLDLNDKTTFTLVDDSFDFSPPDVTRAESSTILTDGGVVSATTLNNRTLSFTLLVQVASRDAMATALSNLHAQLIKARNLIEFRPGTTASKFFRTFASPNVSVEDTGEVGFLRVHLSILAEPYAYGTLVTQAAVSVTNDPTASVRPMYLDVTGVTGDVPTPAIVTIGGPSNQSFAFGVRRHGTPSNALPFVVQAESMTLTGGSALGGPDAVMSGTGSDYVRTTISGDLAISYPVITKTISGLTVDHRGTYRAFVRIRRATINLDTVTVQLHYAGSASDVVYSNAAASTPTLNDDPHLIDLGLIQLPISDDPVTDATGAALGVGDIFLGLAIGRAGTGTFYFDWDYLVLVPADEELTIVNGPSTLTGADLVMDGDRQAAYYLAGGKVIARQMVSVAGAIAPMLTPGQTNRIVFLNNVLAKTTQVNVLTAQALVAVAWLPRYLYV